MNADEQERPGRYDVSGNVEAQYVDAGQAVLKNKKGITDLIAIQILEEEALASAYESLLTEVRVDTLLTCELLRHIHSRIFGELFEWAGRWRTVKISKPGVVWPPPDFLDQAMQAFEADVLAKYPATALRDDASFCAALGEIQGEFLAIHPFREGNARTIKLLTDLLAAQTGRPLLVYDDSDAGRKQYVEAAKRAILKDYVPVTRIIEVAMRQAQSRPRASGESGGEFLPGTGGGPR